MEIESVFNPETNECEMSYDHWIIDIIKNLSQKIFIKYKLIDKIYCGIDYEPEIVDIKEGKINNTEIINILLPQEFKIEITAIIPYKYQKDHFIIYGKNKKQSKFLGSFYSAGAIVPKVMEFLEKEPFFNKDELEAKEILV